MAIHFYVPILRFHAQKLLDLEPSAPIPVLTCFPPTKPLTALICDNHQKFDRTESSFLTELGMNGILRLINDIGRLIDSVSQRINCTTRSTNGITLLMNGITRLVLAGGLAAAPRPPQAGGR